MSNIKPEQNRLFVALWAAGALAFLILIGGAVASTMAAGVDCRSQDRPECAINS